MSKTFKQKRYIKSIGIYNKLPVLINHHVNKPNTFIINEKVFNSSCIGCLNPMCLTFSNNELQLYDERLNEFPIDSINIVCPMEAIIWERESKIPYIIPERCINCGICAKRCIIGAIYSNGEYAIIHFEENGIEFKNITDTVTIEHERQINLISNIKHIGKFLPLNNDSFDVLYKKINNLETSTQFPNLIIRNLFLVLGNKCVIRRRGDIYFRIDAIISDKPIIGIAEVSFKDTLESPRAILDDIAVLSSRYKIEKSELKPFIITLEFPNLRTEYWRVIKDIKNVLNININSLTLGALCLLVWNFVDIPIGSLNFYMDIDSHSIKHYLEKILNNQKIEKIDKYAIYEPIK